MAYGEMLEKGLHYYRIGRPGDIEHINWLYTTAPKYAECSGLDMDILMAVIILHDVGYSEVPKDSDPFNPEIKKIHMEKGAEIAERILKEMNFPAEKTAEVKRLIAHHDDWMFGDDFANEPYLRFFNNFDFMWMASEKGFDIVRGFMKKESVDFYHQIETFLEENFERGQRWYSEDVEKLYHDLMADRAKEIGINE